MTNKKRLLIAIIITLLAPALFASHESYGYVPVVWLLLNTIAALIQIEGGVSLREVLLVLLFNIAIPLVYFGIVWLIIYSTEKLLKIFRR